LMNDARMFASNYLSWRKSLPLHMLIHSVSRDGNQMENSLSETLATCQSDISSTRCLSSFESWSHSAAWT
jgi:hypothetical protein